MTNRYMRQRLVIIFSTCLLCFFQISMAAAMQNETKMTLEPQQSSDRQSQQDMTSSMLPLEASLPMELNADSVLLMEPTTGTVIFESNADDKRPIASINKIMTLLLIIEAFEDGRINKDTPVTVSSHAMGMGGSQALLDAGSVYPAGELLKSIIVASANDASVALVEHLYGSEEAFVIKMNEQADNLIMQNTYFTNCTGLPSSSQDSHYSTARDVAIMSQALLQHPIFFEYSTIWLSSIEHKEGRKTELTNTNRLIRFFEGADGVKTGSTNEAKYCISATAQRGGMRLLAVVLAAPSGNIRFDVAQKMLNYGFSHYQLVKIGDRGGVAVKDVPVRNGETNKIDAVYGEQYAVLLRKGQEKELSFVTEIQNELQAPITAHQNVGKVNVLLYGKSIKTLDIVAAHKVDKPNFITGLIIVLRNWFWR